MKNPLISVILPVYNGGIYLAKAIESILNQSYTNFELIIINDGSKDNSKQVITSFKDNRIRFIDQSNKGLAPTLNIAASFCTGEYIARMDQDDISYPDRFLIQSTFLQTHPAISVISSAVNYIDESGNYLGRSFPVTHPVIIKKYLLYKGSVVCHPCVMMRKKDLENVGGYSELVGGRFTDYHLWVKFVRRGYKIQNLSQILLQYRILESSMTSEFSLDASSKKLLVKVVNDKNLNLDDIVKLDYACKNDKATFSKRNNIYNNKQNSVYLKLSFLGENLRNYLFSGIKNLYGFISFSSE